MAGKITELTTAATPNGTELIEVVQSGANKSASLSAVGTALGWGGGGGGGTPGGSDTQLQFNNAGAFGGASLYWDETNKILKYGGVTASFPAWKRSGTTLQARLADDSGYAYLFAESLSVNGAIGAGTHLIAGAYVICAAGAGFLFDSWTRLRSPADGVLSIINNAQTLRANLYAPDNSTLRVQDDSAALIDVKCRNTIQKPLASVTPANNGELVFELTDDTTLTIKAKGSDGTVRSATLTLTVP